MAKVHLQPILHRATINDSTILLPLMALSNGPLFQPPNFFGALLALFAVQMEVRPHLVGHSCVLGKTWASRCSIIVGPTLGNGCTPGPQPNRWTKGATIGTPGITKRYTPLWCTPPPLIQVRLLLFGTLHVGWECVCHHWFWMDVVQCVLFNARREVQLWFFVPFHSKSIMQVTGPMPMPLVARPCSKVEVLPASRHAQSGNQSHDLSVARPPLSPVELIGMCVRVSGVFGGGGLMGGG